MKFAKFTIKNYKGIEDITFNLDKSPEANIYTLVGLNESGKTTILEAINQFSSKNDGLSAVTESDQISADNNTLIPINKRDNFNDRISIVVTLKLDKDDLDGIEKLAKEKTLFRKIKRKEFLSYYNYYNYENSTFIKLDNRWDGFYGILKTEQTEKYINIGDKDYADDNMELATFCQKMIPSILYFPNFLFDFPSRIYLETKNTPTEKEKFYIDLIQDILNSLDNSTNIQIHLIDRIKSGDVNQRRNIDRLIQLMQNKVSEIVFDAWDRIFKRKIKDTKIAIKYNVDGENLAFLEFEIESTDGIYQLSERSLGFKWFFIFLLFTQFRPYRKGTPSNIIFLFDEPASNLHTSAQKQLLKSFENLISNAKVIYTTHSHHLINPNWLESTYVVKNEGLQLESPEVYNIKKTKIVIEPYRDFAAKHPHNTAYFQPILDVLDYTPSNLENVPNCVFLEGKNDYYTLAYFKDVIFKDYTLNLAPSTGSGNLDTLISLYIGWGKEFIILLDSDKAGKKEKERYIDKFGLIVKQRIYLLSDIDLNWDKKELETLFGETDAFDFQKTAYPETTLFNKTHFNRSIQENLINKKSFNFSTETLDNIKKILDFLSHKMNDLTNI